jgi:hypothetical protein
LISQGNELDAKNETQLEKNGIYYVLNVTKNVPFYNKILKSKLKTKRIAINDDHSSHNFKDYFKEAFDFIG